MRGKWIIIVLIVGLVGWAVYDFAINNNSKLAEPEAYIEQAVSELGSELETETGLKKGSLAPDFELETTDGKTVKLSDFRGEKILLNFWATWCPPCRAEMPDMQKYHEEYEEGIILAVNLIETEQSYENMEKFLDEYGITFSILIDEDTAVSSMYDAYALPTSYLIDTSGKIHTKAIGAINYDLLVQEFEKMN